METAFISLAGMLLVGAIFSIWMAKHDHLSGSNVRKVTYYVTTSKDISNV